jgi:hypothetical protein
MAALQSSRSAAPIAYASATRLILSQSCRPSTVTDSIRSLSGFGNGARGRGKPDARKL